MTSNKRLEQLMSIPEEQWTRDEYKEFVSLKKALNPTERKKFNDFVEKQKINIEEAKETN